MTLHAVAFEPPAEGSARECLRSAVLVADTYTQVAVIGYQDWHLSVAHSSMTAAELLYLLTQAADQTRQE